MSLLDDQGIYYICQKVLKDTVLDAFYIIYQHERGISKIDILRYYQEALGVDSGGKKYRYTIDEAVATLLGTTFIDFFKDGTADRYYLTQSGEIAATFIGHLLEENPDLKKTSKIVSSIMGGVKNE